jgi:hypothetical protein
MSVVFEVIYIPNHGNGQEQKECDSDELRIQRTASPKSPHQPHFSAHSRTPDN